MRNVLPFDIFVNKYFFYPEESAECELALLYFSNDRKCNYRQTKFYQLRLSRSNWLTPGFARIPEGLDSSPRYWVMPWADKYRKPETFRGRLKRWWGIRELVKNFYKVADSIKVNDFDNSAEPIKGFLLERRKEEKRFIYTDGNRRLGILAALCALQKKDMSVYSVCVDVRGEFQRNTFLELEDVKAIMIKYGFSNEDAYRWFDNTFFEHDDQNIENTAGV